MKVIILKSLCMISVILWPTLSYPLDVNWHFGAKIGAGFTHALVDNHSSSSSKLTDKSSLAGGVFVNFSHVDFARIQLEAIYMQKGFKRNGFSANLTALSFPILARFQIPQGVFLNLGIAITVLTGGTVNDSSKSSTDIDDHFERLEYDLEAGIGWEFEVFKGGNIFLELRLSYGLNNISTFYPQEVNLLTTHLYVGFQY
ncbi:MAG TPA: PorT family protein [Spirochaetes bacterium]|nr:PorT family protein [Spirochaetota bacterium]